MRKSYTSASLIKCLSGSYISSRKLKESRFLTRPDKRLIISRLTISQLRPFVRIRGKMLAGNSGYTGAAICAWSNTLDTDTHIAATLRNMNFFPFVVFFLFLTSGNKCKFRLVDGRIREKVKNVFTHSFYCFIRLLVSGFGDPVSCKEHHRFRKSERIGWMKRSMSRMSSVMISAVPSISWTNGNSLRHVLSRPFGKDTTTV